MKQVEIVALGIRAAVLLLVFYVIRDGSAYLAAIGSYGNEDKNWIMFGLAIMGFLIIAAVLLYKFPLTMAKGLLPKTMDSNIKTQISLDEIQVAAFAIIGVFILVMAVPDIFYWAILIYQFYSIEPSNEGLSINYIANVVATTVELIMAVWLILGGKGILNLFNSLRYAGK